MLQVNYGLLFLKKQDILSMVIKMRIEFASTQDFPALKKMWKEIFMDTDAYIELFFLNKAQPNNILVIRKDMQIVSMLYLIKAPLISKDGTQIEGIYICGVATAPAYRGKGFASALIHAACQTARERGAAVCWLIPANQDLFRYYAEFGFSAKTYLNILDVTPEPGRIPAYSTDLDLNAMKTFYDMMNFPFKSIRTNYDMQLIYKCYKQVLLFENGYIVLDEDKENLYVLEQSFDAVEIVKAIAYEKKKKKVKLYMPSVSGKGKPFAMFKMLNSKVQLPDNGYVQLMLN